VKKRPNTTLVGPKDEVSEKEPEIRDKEYQLNSASDLGSPTPTEAVRSETRCRRQERYADNRKYVLTEPQRHKGIEVKYRHRRNYDI